MVYNFICNIFKHCVTSMLSLLLVFDCHTCNIFNSRSFFISNKYHSKCIYISILKQMTVWETITIQTGRITRIFETFPVNEQRICTLPFLFFKNIHYSWLVSLFHFDIDHFTYFEYDITNQINKNYISKMNCTNINWLQLNIMLKLS